jgi:hypothetical protein
MTDALSQVRPPAGLPVTTGVTLTTPVRMLQRLSGRVAMVVLGRHAIEPSDAVIGRPGTSPVSTTSLCPVVIIPRHGGRNQLQTRSIVVGLDGRTPAEVVLSYTFAEAERCGWPIVALQAVPPEGDAPRGPGAVGRRAPTLYLHLRPTGSPDAGFIRA